MTLHRFPARWLIGLFITTNLIGCDRGTTERPLVPAGGEVRVNGQPATGALVLLTPANAIADPEAPYPRAKVGQDGRFQLTTYRRDDGAPPGEYRATVTWEKPIRVSRFRRDDADRDSGDDETHNVLPEQYADPATSGLTVIVPEEGSTSLTPIRITTR